MNARRVARHVAAAGAVTLALAAGGARATAPALTLGAEDDAAPWSYADGSGYVNELVRAAYREMGWTVTFKVMPYARCKALAVAGALAGCFTVSRTPELETQLLFPKAPVLQARNVLLARADAAAVGCDATAWSRPPVIGVVRGYEYAEAVDALLRGGRARPEVADSEVSNLRKLHAGRIDAGLVTVDEVKRADYLRRLARLPDAFRTVCDFGEVPAYVAFSRAHPQGAAALAAFDEGHARLQRRGAVAALQGRWRAQALDTAAAKRH